MTVKGPIDPRNEVERFLSDEEDDVVHDTLINHQYRLERFLEWCEETGFDDLTELTGRKANDYRRHRKKNSGIALVTLSNQLKTFRVFVKYCEDNDSVPIGVSDQIQIPSVEPEDEKADDRDLDPERADRILDYLNKYEYASLDHVLFALLSDMGCRIGAIHSIDVDDLKYRDDGRMYVELEHRPDTDTKLKRQRKGERNVILGIQVENIQKVVEDYLDDCRTDVEDEHGRKPLITTQNGRMVKGTMRNRMYGITHSKRLGEECDHTEDGKDCPFTAYRERQKCPETHSPHSARHAFVSRMRAYDDLPDDILGDRIDMTVDTMERYYDERDESERMDQRERIMNKALSDD
ncbi:tyrosine-type recombinase/integrase [Halococcus agarilyticus]|uniref:tyrosine-type recombinase/integrase n=1 Tax=Halococcus agarilyticus TaxID=1232219 RepID=UPI000677BD18|nr:tyrosine-type recombinase/integrase [Halococcus agarilyticus]